MSSRNGPVPPAGHFSMPGGDGESVRGGPGAYGGARILVVEDSPSARRLMQAQLTRLGVGLPDLRLTPTIPEAIQTFTAWQPQVVFVDLELRPPPDRPAPAKGSLDGLPKDGAELVDLLLQRDPAVQIIVCSATQPLLSNVASKVRDGTVQGLVKPVVATRLREVLSRAAAARESSPAPTMPRWRRNVRSDVPPARSERN
jgi:CheY-like chemotaxis protein